MTSILLGVRPARGLAYIKHITTEERYGGSPIIITPTTRDRISVCQFILTAVGDYEFCEDVEECERPRHTKRGEHKHDLVEGQWVLVRNRSWSLTPELDVFVVRQGDILGRFIES